MKCFLCETETGLTEPSPGLILCVGCGKKATDHLLEAIRSAKYFGQCWRDQFRPCTSLCAACSPTTDGEAFCHARGGGCPITLWRRKKIDHYAALILFQGAQAIGEKPETTQEGGGYREGFEG